MMYILITFYITSFNELVLVELDFSIISEKEIHETKI